MKSCGVGAGERGEGGGEGKACFSLERLNLGRLFPVEPRIGDGRGYCTHDVSSTAADFSVVSSCYGRFAEWKVLIGVFKRGFHALTY